MIGPAGGGSGGGDGFDPLNIGSGSGSSSSSSNSDSSSGFDPLGVGTTGDEDDSSLSALPREINKDISHRSFANSKAAIDDITGTTLTATEAANLGERARVPDGYHHRLVLPHETDGGIESIVTVLERLHRPTRSVSLGLSSPPTHAIEYWYDASTGEITSHLFFGSEQAIRTFDDIAFEAYPDSSIQHAVTRYPTGMFDEGRGVAAASHSTIRRDRWPIRQATDTGKTGFEPHMRVGSDPLGSLFGAMARNPDTSILVQVAFQPVSWSALTRWWRVSRRLDRIEALDEDAREAVETKSKQQLYRMEVRTIATADPNGRHIDSPTEDAAESVTAVANAFDAFDHRNQTVKQGFAAKPVSGWTNYTFRKNLTHFACSTLDIDPPGSAREGPTESSDLSLWGLAGTGHVPGEVDNSRLARSTLVAGDPVPTTLPRFPWEAVDIDPNAATIDEKGRAILLNPHLSDDIYYGICVRDGVEVGVPWHPTEQKSHTITSGRSGEGKTSTLLFKLYKLAALGKDVIPPVAEREREHALTSAIQDGIEDVDALLSELDAGEATDETTDETTDEATGQTTVFYDPKGNDMDDLIAAHPGPPEETVIWSIGGNNPGGYEVGINPLEIPLDVDPSSREFSELLEPRVEAMKALMALAGGGSEDYFGPRMQRLTDVVSRALTLGVEHGYQPGVYDFSGALLTAAGREELAADASRDREEFVGELAEMMLNSLNDSDIEPTLGRLTSIMISPTKRANIARPRSTFSFHDVVANGWDLFIEDTSVDQRLGQMAAAEAVICLWMAVRELAADPDRPDPQPVELVLDEIPVIITKYSELADVLGQARAYDLHADMAGQDWGNQVPEELEGLARSQTDRTVSFNPGTDDEDAIAAKHSEGVEIDQLTELPKYEAYVRVPDRDGTNSPSLRTRMFNRPAELLPEEMVRSDEQVQAFREASYRIHGEEELTAAEVRRQARYFESIDVDDDVDAETELDDQDHQPFYKTIYDSQIRHSDSPLDPGPIPFDTLAAALRTTLATQIGQDEEDIHDGQIESIKDRLVREHLAESDDYHYHVEPDGLTFLDQGESPTAGKKEHRRGVTQTYHHLTHYLSSDSPPQCSVSIPDQGGSSDLPDLTIDDPFSLSGSGLAARKQRRQFEADHPLRAVFTQGSDTAVEFEHTTKHKSDSLIEKVTRSFDADEACLFITWSQSDAETVHGHLTTTEARDTIPDAAVWNIVVLPTDDDAASAPRLYLAAGDPALLSLPDVSPEAIAAATDTDSSDDSSDSEPPAATHSQQVASSILDDLNTPNSDDS